MPARAKRRYRASITSISRNISGGPSGSPAIWIALGDSIPVEVAQFTCTSDVCTGSSGGVAGATWTIDDTTVVGIAASSPTIESADFGSVGPRTYLVGRARGRTKVRASLPPSPADTISYREPPRRRLERDVIVSPRAARLEIVLEDD